MSPQDVLRTFEKWAVTRWRVVRSSNQRDVTPMARFASDGGFDKSLVTLRTYVRGYFGNEWPLIDSPQQMVILCDAAPPHELLWVSQSTIAALSLPRELLEGQAGMAALRPGEQVNLTHLTHMYRVRDGLDASYDWDDIHWICANTQWLNVHLHATYGPESRAFLIKADPLGEPYWPKNLEGRANGMSTARGRLSVRAQRTIVTPNSIFNVDESVRYIIERNTQPDKWRKLGRSG